MGTTVVVKEDIIRKNFSLIVHGQFNVFCLFFLSSLAARLFDCRDGGKIFSLIEI